MLECSWLWIKALINCTAVATMPKRPLPEPINKCRYKYEKKTRYYFVSVGSVHIDAQFHPVNPTTLGCAFSGLPIGRFHHTDPSINRKYLWYPLHSCWQTIVNQPINAHRISASDTNSNWRYTQLRSKNGCTAISFLRTTLLTRAFPPTVFNIVLQS